MSAGFAPLSIGTETDGSLVNPADRAALYAIKPTIGLVSQQGIIPVSHTMDSAGLMATTAYDLATLLEIIRGESANVKNQDLRIAVLNVEWFDLSIGALDYERWIFSEKFLKPDANATIQMVDLTSSAKAKESFKYSAEVRISGSVQQTSHSCQEMG